MPQDPRTLDPHAAADDNSLLYISNIFDGLVELEPGTTNIAPALAESWELSADGLTYTFKLRDGIRFHNGRAVVAEDVIYSLKRALSPGFSGPLLAPLLVIRGAKEFYDNEGSEIPGLSVKDSATVVITLEKTFPPFLGVLTSQVGSILPEEVYSDPGEAYLRNPVGAGPFRFESWDTGIEIKMKAFPDHWKGQPGIAGVTVRMIPDVTTAFEEFKAGQLDYMNEVPTGQKEFVKKNMPGQYKKWSRLGFAAVGFNHQLAPLKGNPTLRRALNFAVDRVRIARDLQGGKDVPFARIIPAGLQGHNPDPGPFRYDPEEARRLLAEAGYPEGKGLKAMEMLVPPNEAMQRYAQAIQGDMAEIGVKVSLSAIDFSTYVQELYGGIENPPSKALYALVVYADYPDNDGFFRQLFHTASFGSPGNFGLYSNAEVDRLLDAARHEIDPSRRNELYSQAETIALEDGATLPLYMYGEDSLISPDLEGFHPNPQGEFGVALELLHFKS
jgi:oligopeptide transport system substrate-binding protein